MTFDSELNGEPVIITVTYYNPGFDGSFCGSPDFMEPQSESEIEFEVRDKAGNLTGISAGDLTDSEVARIEVEYIIAKGELFND